jgi:hypothetical protein
MKTKTTRLQLYGELRLESLKVKCDKDGGVWLLAKYLNPVFCSGGTEETPRDCCKNSTDVDSLLELLVLCRNLL